MKPLGNIDICRKYVIYEHELVDGKEYRIYRKFLFIKLLQMIKYSKGLAIQWARYKEISGKPRKIYETGKGEI